VTHMDAPSLRHVSEVDISNFWSPRWQTAII